MSELVPLRLHLISAAAVAVLMMWIALLVRANRLSLRDSLLWLISTAIALAFAVFPGLLAHVARALGIATPINAAFAMGMLYVVANLVSITLKTASNSVTLRRLVQELGLLRAELEALKTDPAQAGSEGKP